MTVELLEHPTQLQTAEGGQGGLPPTVPETAVAAPEPPEQERFNPDQAELRRETDAEFAAITSHLGETAARGQQIVADQETKNP